MALVSGRTGPAINPSVPLSLVPRLFWLADPVRAMGIRISATKGAGKSTEIGAIIAWLDFLRRIPVVLLDPSGGATDAFFSRLLSLPREYQEQLWPRVLYVDMSGRDGFVVPFPLYYRLGQESLFAVSQRYLDVIQRLDPYLVTASVEGWNSLWRGGTYAGMALAALGCQITEADHLLHHLSAWEARLRQVAQRQPEAAQAVEFLHREFGQGDRRQASRSAGSFLTKAALLGLDPTLRAMFGASSPGVDWHRVVQERLAVLLDFRHLQGREILKFQLLWVFHYLLDFIRYRGPGRHIPISVLIDELPFLLKFQALNTSLLADDLDELVNRLSRANCAWLTTAQQELTQVDEKTQKTLLTMGTQIFGSTGDIEAALSLVPRFFRYDPHWVRKYEPVYSSFRGYSWVIDYTSTEYSLEEQQHLNAYKLMDLPRYHFLVALPPEEGTLSSRLHRVSIEQFDRGHRVPPHLIALARERLMALRGRKVSDVLAEVDARLPTKETVKLTQPPAQRKVPLSESQRPQLSGPQTGRGQESASGDRQRKAPARVSRRAPLGGDKA